MPKRKKIRIAVIVSILACVLAGVILFETVGVAMMVKPYSEAVLQQLQKDEDQRDWTLITDASVTLSTDKMELVMDTATGHFTVEDLSTHHIYHSALTAEQATSSSAAMVQAAQSEVLLSYYDKNDALLTMTTAGDALPYGAPKVYVADDAVRVRYRLGVVKEQYLVPIAVCRETFEEYVAKAGKGTRKLRLYYDLYSYSKPNESFPAMVKEYPCLNDHEVYLLRQDSMTDTVLEELAGYWETAGYTEEIYQQELELLNLEVPEAEKETSFTVDVEYSLTDEGMSVCVPVSGISAGLEIDRAYSVSVLPYFGCMDMADNGMLLVPDGSGAVIRLGNSNGASYTQKVYGDDVAKTQKKQTQLTQNVILPAFGFGAEDGGFVAYIDGGAPHAKVCAKTAGGIQPASTVYSEFVLQEYDVTTIGESRQMSDIPLFSPLLLQEDPTLTYALIQPSENPENTMVTACRTMLEQKGVLSATTTAQEWPLFLDFTGILYSEKTFLGIPYQEKEVLSTISEVADVVSYLHEHGVERLIIRLIGFSTDGALGGADCRMMPDAAVGTEVELQQLKALVESKGGTLYWESSLSAVYDDGLFDSFVPESDAVRRMNRKTAIVNGVDRVTLKYSVKGLERYLVSPANYAERLDDLLSSTDQPLSLSWGEAGSLLYSDFRTDRPYDRCMSVWEITDTLSRMAQQGAVLTEGGNAYSWSYVSGIVDIPLKDSGYDITSYAYPFVQSVLRNRIEYAGVAVNTTSYPELQTLYAAMSGSALHYSWITRDDDTLLDTPYEQEYYSLSYTHWIDGAIEEYHRQKAVADATVGEEMTGFTQCESGVYRLCYGNDAEVIVNTNNKEVTVDDRVISAMSWVFVSSDGKESAQ